jgi:Bacterial SH3 domain
MRVIRIQMAILAILGLATLGCNIGIKAPLVINPDNAAAATIVSLTLQAATQSAASSPAVPFASPLAATPISAKAILTVNNPTNCRSGPGQNFQLITAFPASTTVAILGKDTADDYWLVMLPNGIDTCWASGQYTTASGSFANLPEITPTASAGNGVPARPGSLFYTWQGPCSNLTTSLSWADAANNETGYHVFRNNVQIADLPANSTNYVDVTNIGIGSTISYGVEAYNQAGVSARRNISFACK